MKLINTLNRMRHAVYGNAGIGVTMTIAGLIQANTALMYGGIFWILASVTVLILVLVNNHGVAEMTFVVEGVIVDPQQPQLPDVQTHMRRTPELSQAG